jgi:hypothetical protein
MTTFFAGDVVAATDLEALTPDPFNEIIVATDSATITNAEAVSLTLPSATYKAGKAYRVWIGGGVTYSTATAFSSWNIKKGTTTAGAVVLAMPRQPVGGHTNEIHLNMQGVFVVGAADVTTQLCLAVACNSTNTLVHKGTTAGNPRQVTIFRAGQAANWSGMPVLS